MKKSLFEIGAKLEGMQSDKSGKLIVSDKSPSTTSYSHQEPLVFKREKRNGKVVTIVGRFVCNDDEKKRY